MSVDDEFAARERKAREAACRRELLEQLRAEIAETNKRPTALEIARLAALMGGAKAGPKKFLEAAERALGMWRASAMALTKLITEEISPLAAAEGDDGVSSQITGLPEWVTGVEREDFPIPFEKALLLIFGKGTRRGVRGKKFHDFCRDQLLAAGKPDDGIEQSIIAEFTKLKADGFDAPKYYATAIGVEQWAKARLSNKGKRASQIRWKKKSKAKGSTEKN